MIYFIFINQRIYKNSNNGWSQTHKYRSDFIYITIILHITGPRGIVRGGQMPLPNQRQ